MIFFFLFSFPPLHSGKSVEVVGKFDTVIYLADCKITQTRRARRLLSVILNILRHFPSLKPDSKSMFAPLSVHIILP